MITTEVDPEHRRAVRQFTSGVAVLTLADAHGTHGTTVSALVAVSREPLVIGVCLSQRSSFLRRVRERRWFSVNVLNSQQALLARWFADRNRPPGDAQFAGLSFCPDPVSAAPLLAHSLAHLTCCLHRCVPVGDHVLLLAEVTVGRRGAGLPLLTFAGHLHDEVFRPCSERYSDD